MRKPDVKFVLIAAAVTLATATASASIEFKSGGATLRLSETCGAVESLVAGSGRAGCPQPAADGQNRVVPAAEAFTLQLLDGKGEPTLIKSSEFKFEPRVTFADGGRGATALPMGVGRAGSPCPPIALEWRHANGLVVRMEVTAADGEFRFTPSVEGIPAGMLLEWFDGPQVCISPDRALYWPYWDGCEVTDFSCRRYRPIGYVERFGESIDSLYPGFCQMQFMAAYKDGKGVYFSAVDGRHTPKGVEWERVGDKAVRLSLQTFCGDLTDGAWRPKFHYALRPYDGAWMEACEIYRDWVRALPGFDHPPARPKWMYDSPVNLIYPVRGVGSDHSPRDMKPNCYFPYVNAMSAVEKYGKALDSRIMALVMHWEGTAPWAPPYVWPPYGGEEELAKFREALHARGDLLGVYCSGTAWTQISSIVPRYSLEQRFEDERLGRHMMRGPKGEITAYICNGHEGQRLGYDMCLAEDWPIRTVEDEVGKIARFGIDYCQFFDQNLGGGWLLCYAKHHSHPPIPGAWATDAMASLQKRLVASAGSHDMALGCESVAATPYVPNLFYNDARSMIGVRFGRPVPGLAFVFHEWQCNFSGNMCGISQCDPFWRWMYCFHNGDMLSLILGPDDGLVEAWCRPWREKFPEQGALVPLVRWLNAIRKKYPSFLLEGRMIRPFVACESRPAKVRYCLWGGTGEVETKEVFTSFWENAKGERIGFASNWRREPSDLKITYADGRVETRTLAPLEVIELRPDDALAAASAFGVVEAGAPCRTRTFRRVMFCGNSLTCHGPNAAIGWTNNWGMAASAPERDYVHLLVRALEARSGTRPEFVLKPIPLERGYENAEKLSAALANAVEWKPDLVVLAYGENAHSVTNDANEALCRAAYLKTTRALREAGAEVVLRAPFWPSGRFRRILSGVAEETGAIYVDIGDLGNRDEMTAKGLFKHGGVAMHPGDAGMIAIADRILAAIVEHLENEKEQK